MEDVRGRFTGDDPGWSTGTGLDSREEVVIGGRTCMGGVGEENGVDLIRRDDLNGAMYRPSAA